MNLSLLQARVHFLMSQLKLNSKTRASGGQKRNFCIEVLVKPLFVDEPTAGAGDRLLIWKIRLPADERIGPFLSALQSSGIEYSMLKKHC